MADQAEANHAAAQAIRTSSGRLALRFISGKYQGGEFPLEGDKEIIIGRSSGLDMVLVEEMVSRRHAKITVKNEDLGIEDMGSTNGTFVNGEKIKQASLREGDRVLIGTSILKVVATANVTTQSQAQQSLESLAAKQATVTRGGGQAAGPARMSGTVDEIPLPDLLQLFATSKKNGVLVVRTDTDTGRIYLKEGTVHYCEIEANKDLPPLKAIYRMLGWLSGVFQLDPPVETSFAEPLDSTVQAILMEGFRQQDELDNLKAKLPPGKSSLPVKKPMDGKLTDLSPTQLDVFQVALETATLDEAFDKSPLTDLETGEAILHLVKKGYLLKQ